MLVSLLSAMSLPLIGGVRGSPRTPKGIRAKGYEVKSYQ
jgi:hypothetical protein